MENSDVQHADNQTHLTSLLLCYLNFFCYNGHSTIMF